MGWQRVWVDAAAAAAAPEEAEKDIFGFVVGENLPFCPGNGIFFLCQIKIMQRVLTRSDKWNCLIIRASSRSTATSGTFECCCRTSAIGGPLETSLSDSLHPLSDSLGSLILIFQSTVRAPGVSFLPKAGQITLYRRYISDLWPSTTLGDSSSSLK